MNFKKKIAAVVSFAFLASATIPYAPQLYVNGSDMFNVSAAETEETNPAEQPETSENKCGDNAFWSLDEEGMLTISGSGAIYNYESDNSPWDKTKVTAITIENGITAIGNFAFAGCAVKSITVPESVSCVGESAFYNCGADIYLNSVPAQIGNEAFTGDIVHYGEAEVFDYTQADFIGGKNLSLAEEDIKDITITLSRYDGKDSAEYGINAGDTLKINVDWNGYTPTGKIFYGTNTGYMLYMPDTYNYTDGMQKYYTANPYFITEGTAKSVNVNVYEVTDTNTITRICTTTFTFDAQADDETFKNSLEGISTVMFEGQSKTVQQILAEAGIGHVDGCLSASSVKIADGENVSVDFLTGEIKADSVGTAVIDYNASVDDCIYHQSASATGNKLTVYVAQMPQITATETAVTIESIEGYEYYLNGITAGEKNADGDTVFTGLEAGKNYTVVMKTADGMGQTGFEVSVSGHKLVAETDSKDKSKAVFSCGNDDCTAPDEIADYFVSLNVLNDGSCEVQPQIEKSENLENVQISEIKYYDAEGNEVPENQLENTEYTIKVIVGDGETDVTLENSITLSEHSFTEGVCDNCGSIETVIENTSFETVYTYGDEIAAPEISDFTTNGNSELMTMVWYDSEGNVLENLPAEVGSYKLSVNIPSHTYNSENYTSANLDVDVTVEKVTELSADDFTVEIPEELTFDGEAKSVAITALNENLGDITVKYYDAEGNETEPVNAGTYTFAVDVAETENNAEIKGITSEDWTFEIEKLKTLTADDFVFEIPENTAYTGEAINVTVTPVPEGIGDVTVKYYDMNGKEAEPVAIGTYTVKIDVAEGTNNIAVSDITGAKWTLTVSKAPASVITPPQPIEGLVYDGETHELVLPGEAHGGTMMYCLTKSGIFEETVPVITNAGTYTVWYYVKGDGVSYTNSEKYSVEVTVAQISAKLDTAPQAVENLSYTGSSQKLVVPGESETGTLMYSLTQGAGYSSKIPTAIYAGTYTVWYYVEGDAPNYYNTEPASIQVTISQSEAIVRSAPTPKTNLVYDGTELALVASGKAKGGTMVYALAEDGNFLMKIPTAKNAGTYQVWYYVKSSDKNYIDSQKAYVEVTIAEAPTKIITAPTAIEGLVYDGEPHQLVTAGTTENGTVVYSLEEDGEYSAELPTVTNAGTYTVWYYVQGNENYADTEKASVEVTVEKIDSELKTAPAANKLVYNGEAQKLVTAGTATGGTVVYAIEKDGVYTEEIPVGTDAGTYTVWYYVKGDVNHFDGEKSYVEVVVEKAPATVITAPTAIQELIYNEQEQTLITAGEAENGVMVYSISPEDVEFSENLPSALNADTYTVWYYAEGDGINYTDSEMKSVEVTIEKAASVVNPVIEDKEYSEGDALPSISLSEGDTIGDILWTANDTFLQLGDNILEWFFTPDDVNYTAVTGTMIVSAKATTTSETTVTETTSASTVTETETTVTSTVTETETTVTSTVTGTETTVTSTVTETETTVTSTVTETETTVTSTVTETETTVTSTVTETETTVTSTVTKTETTVTSTVTKTETTVTSTVTKTETTVTSTVTETETTVTSTVTKTETTVTSTVTKTETTVTSTVTKTETTVTSTVTETETTVTSTVTKTETSSQSSTSQTTEVSTTTTVETKTVIVGDANEDGKVNVRDAALIANMLAKGCADALPFTADFDMNKSVNVRDAAAIARVLASNEAYHWIQIIIKVYPK